MFSAKTYSERRNKLKQSFSTGLILMPGNAESSMNYKDNLYHFRQDSTFLYYTGIDLPNLFFIIDIDNDSETLFGNDLSIDEIIWTGPKASLSTYTGKSSIAGLQPLTAIAAVLKNAIQKNTPVHFTPPYRAETGLRLSEWLDIPYQAIEQNASLSLIRAIIAQRSFKTAEEIAEIHRAVDTTAAMQLKAIRQSQPGLAEYEIAGQLEAVATMAGGHLAFPTILTVNGQYLHNHAGSNNLQKGQLVLCDCGAETARHYAGDMTRTFPVDRKFTTSQREMYDIVLQAQESAIAALKPGTAFIEIHLLACEKLTEGLKQLGLIKGDVREAVALGVHTLFFQCGLGHMMGLDVHDMENLGEKYVGYTDTIQKSTEFGLKSLRLGKELEEGFVVTIEPGIYMIPELMDQWRAEKKHIDFINYDKLNAYRSFGGIRVEEDFLITATGSTLLGNPLAKKALELEVLKEASLNL